MQNDPSPAVRQDPQTPAVQNAPAAVPKTREVRSILRYLILLLAVLILTNPALIPFLPAEVKEPMLSALTSLFGDVTQISRVVAFDWIHLFKLIVMLLTLMLVREVLVYLLTRLKPQSGRASTLKYLALSGISYLTVLIGVFWGLSILGVNLSTLFASVGILALIVGFGAESLVADMVTGLFMIFENEYNVGDIIELDGYRGTVSSIGIRTTSVTDAGGNVKIVNNSNMRNVINLSNRASRAVCDFCIPYEVSIAEAEAALNSVLEQLPQQYPDVFKEKPEYVGVQELGKSSVVLRVVAVVEESSRFSAARLLNRALKIGMEKKVISSPFNQLGAHSSR